MIFFRLEKSLFYLLSNKCFHLSSLKSKNNVCASKHTSSKDIMAKDLIGMVFCSLLILILTHSGAMLTLLALFCIIFLRVENWSPTGRKWPWKEKETHFPNGVARFLFKLQFDVFFLQKTLPGERGFLTSVSEHKIYPSVWDIVGLIRKKPLQKGNLIFFKKCV